MIQRPYGTGNCVCWVSTPFRTIHSQLFDPDLCNDRDSKQLLFRLAGHTDSVVSVAFNVAGTMLASAAMDGFVKLWNPADGTLLRTLEGMLRSLLLLARCDAGR